MNEMKMALVGIPYLKKFIKSLNKHNLNKRWVKKIDGQTSTPENLLMGKVPDGHCSDGHCS